MTPLSPRFEWTKAGAKIAQIAPSGAVYAADASSTAGDDACRVRSDEQVGREGTFYQGEAGGRHLGAGNIRAADRRIIRGRD